MKCVIKPHARKRMKERDISDSVLNDALAHPTQIGYDSRGRILLRSLYQKAGKNRLLLIVGEKQGETLEIITVIDTSKIHKYL